MKQITYKLLVLSLVSTLYSTAQDIELFQQFNGRYDYTAIGNTFNLHENVADSECVILTESSASLSLDSNQNVTAAYLYWAGSGPGDFEIEFNDIPISAERNFLAPLGSGYFYFAGFADVTSIVQTQGNTTYTVSEFDISDILDVYCEGGINFGGWAMTIIYEDNNLPLNQLNVYDGFQRVPDSIIINLDNLNVLDNVGAKIGFIAWEGDANLASNEQLTINGNIIGNPPLNPFNNAFNGTNSFTGASNLYNMDIDVYNIENNISIGDTSAVITLTSSSDIVVVNNIVTVLNSQLPDATIAIENAIVNCGDRSIDVDYTVYNTNSTQPLPSGTPIAFYAEGILIGQSQTQNELSIGGSEMDNIVLFLPDNVPTEFLLTAVVDDDGNGNGIILETDESNNTDTLLVELLVLPPIVELPEQIACNEGFNSATFNLLTLLNMSVETDNEINFYESIVDLEAEQNEIINPENYSNSANPSTIYAKVESPPCYESYAFELSVENCPPNIPDGFSPNSDGTNDWFNIEGLYDVFEQHELKVFNRYGTLIFEGDNANKWEGVTNRGINNQGKLVPVGTYFYILSLNHPNFSPQIGWVYVNY